MKVIICGTRAFNDYKILQQTMTRFVEIFGAPTEIITGGCKGADELGGKWAANRNITEHQFLPNWNFWGKSAGPKRNSDMVNHADAVVAFWDGQSKGTEDTIKKARKRDILCWVIYYHRENNSKWYKDLDGTDLQKL